MPDKNQIAHDVAGSKRSNVLLVTVDIHDGVGRNGFSAAGWKHVNAVEGVGARQLRRNNFEAVVDRRVWRRNQARQDCERS